RWWLRHEPYPHGRSMLLDDFRLFTVVGDLLHTALEHRWTFAYQLNARRQPLGPEDQRWLRKNLLSVEEDRSLPRPVVALQGRVVDQRGRAGFLVDEFVGFTGHTARARLFDTVEAAFVRSFSGLGLPGPEFEAEQDGSFDTLITGGIHSSVGEE